MSVGPSNPNPGTTPGPSPTGPQQPGAAVAATGAAPSVTPPALPALPEQVVPPGNVVGSRDLLPGETIGKAIIRRRGYGRITSESIERFLEAYRQTGTVVTACLAAGLSTTSIESLRKTDPDFADEMVAAKEQWVAEFLDEKIKKIGIEGIDEPIYNTKTGVLLGFKKVIQPQVTLAYARKMDPNYREKQDVAVSHSGGVMVVSAPLRDVADWKNQFGNNNKPFDDAEFTVKPDQPAGDANAK